MLHNLVYGDGVNQIMKVFYIIVLLFQVLVIIFPTGITRTVFFDNTYEILYVGFMTNGVYQYDTKFGVGEHLSAAIPFTTNGVEIPNDPVRKIYKDETKNKIYVSSTTNGIWSYNLANGKGKIFNTLSGVTYGSNLPSNNLSVFFCCKRL